MGIFDGTVGGATRILDNGPDDSRLNLVLVAEGFQGTEQAAFDAACDGFVDTLKAEPWYPLLGGAINVHRLNVSSTDSGADDPATCKDGSQGTGVGPKTYFDASFCHNGLTRRCLMGDAMLVRDTLDLAVPQWHTAAVLVNTTVRGGCASGNVFFTALSTDWHGVVLHELGHAAFGLADEYEYKVGCPAKDVDPKHDQAPAGEPVQPNITAESTLAALKWGAFVGPTVPVPTMQNPDCATCDPSPNVRADDLEIGLFEGAGYYHCGLYRPAYRCRMRNSTQPFCRVCVDALAGTLAAFLTPAPQLQVVTADGSPVLDFGDVAHGLTMYRWLEVRNLLTAAPGSLDVTLTPPAAPFSLAPGTSLSFTLPEPVYEPYTSRRVYVAFASLPPGATEHVGTVTAATLDDPAQTSVPVDLLGRAVPPQPVDSVLVIDRSASMGEPGGPPGMAKVDLAIEAASLYVSLLRDDDRIGVVRYASESLDPDDVLLGMTVAGPPVTGAGRVAANARLNPTDLAPAGDTSIGAGIMRGSEVLAGAAVDARALVVLTDGIQNTPPDIPTATLAVSGRTPPQRVFAVGLGLDQLEDKLAEIATATDGVAQITGELSGQREFLLQKLYVQILADVSDEALVRDPRGIVPPGERRATDVWIGEVDVAADFILLHRASGRGAGRYWLEAPDGTEIHPEDVGAHPGVQLVAGSSHAYFRWRFPAFPADPQAHLGRWRVWVENDAPADAGRPLYYSVMCKARSNFRLDGRVLQAAHAPGSRMTVVLEPTLYGQPVALSEPVEARVARPDGAFRTLALARDGNGSYRGELDDTWPAGPYHFTAEVSATTPAGRHVTRYRHLTGLIFVAGGGKTGGGGRDDCCEKAVRRLDWLLWLAVFIALLVGVAVVLLFVLVT